MPAYVLAIDQGTTSSRAIVFDAEGGLVTAAQRELRQHYPADGWVEHDANEIWADTVAVAREAIETARVPASEIASVGITNQRETVVLWERDGGRPVHHAIVWQDRRTSERCRRLVADGLEEHVKEHTGLVIDPYFSATKLAWLLDEVPDARARAERGELAFGTVDSYLLYRLTGGAVHATDASNASRTMLFDVFEQEWDGEMLRVLGIPRAILPEVRDCSGELGTTTGDLFGRPLPITGMAGDQQAASFGQACFRPGLMKSTYGTGCFALLNTGTEPVTSRNRLLTTVAWRIGGEVTYALEGGIFNAGTAIQWVRDGLRAIGSAEESEAVARSRPGPSGVVMVPAFTGLGAPWWDPDARGAIFGITRDTTSEDIVRAALESVALQTHDLLAAMRDDVEAAGTGTFPETLRVDGGMVANDWFCQCLADTLDRPVERPELIETTALGAAYLSGLASGVYASVDALAGTWRAARRFDPREGGPDRERRIAAWRDAIGRVRTRRLEGTT